MPRLTELAHQICADCLSAGDIAVDATVGNGHDTLFLAEQVGLQGHVYGFDIQPEGILKTKQRLSTRSDGENNSLPVTLFEQSHALLESMIECRHHGRVKVVMFNLGYLPGGNQDITTCTESTVQAIQSACRLLHPEGLISILAYPGHAGGDAETDAVLKCLDDLIKAGWFVNSVDAVAGSTTAPRLLILSRNEAGSNIARTHQ